jgi:hypothetical protein
MTPTERATSQAADLRQMALLCRRMASVPTAGGRHEDRVLLAMADQLEREAAEIESQPVLKRLAS